MVKNEKEKNLNLNPQAEGSNAASDSKQKGKEVERISEAEINQQINKINNLIQTNNGEFLNTEKIKEATKEKLVKDLEERVKAQPFGPLTRFAINIGGAIATGGVCREIISSPRRTTIDEILETHKDIILREQNQLAHELENSKQVLIRVCEMTKEQEKKWEADKTKLEGKINEQNKQLNTTQKEAERIQQERKEANEKMAEEVNRIKLTQRQEKTKIEKLRSESERAKQTAEEKEKEIQALISAYEELEKNQQVLVLEYQMVHNNWEVLLIEEGKLKTAIAGLQEKEKNKEQEINNWKDMYENMEISRNEWEQKHNQLSSERITINQQINQLKAEKTNLNEQIETLTEQIKQLNEIIKKKEKEILDQTRKKNWALFASTVQGFTTELMGEKWGNRANSAIQFTTGATLLSNMGEWTYEFWLMGIGVSLVFVVPRLYNVGADMLEKWAGVKLPRWNAKDKISAKLDELNEKAKEKAREAINVVVNMGQPQNNESQSKNLTEISSDTITKEEEKTEIEKPAQNSKKNGSEKKKKNKKKVKGDSG